MNVLPLARWLFNIYHQGGNESFVKTGVTVGQVLFDGWVYPRVYSLLLLLAGMEPQFEGGKFGYYRGVSRSRILLPKMGNTPNRSFVNYF